MGGIDIVAFRKTDEGKQLASWLRSEFDKAKTARKQKELQWYVNMSMVLGNQWVKPLATKTNSGLDTKLIKPTTPAYKERRTINRARSFVRWELSKFISNTPSIVSVPGTGSDEDVRASYAAEQAWTSISNSKKLRQHFAKAAWWMILTGNGFIKVDWDPFALSTDQQPGDIRFSAITPFHLFVPDLREPELEDQPFIIFAYTKSAAWVKRYWADELGDAKLQPTSRSASLIDEAYLNLNKQSDTDNVTIFELWAKPGATDLLPNGGVVVMTEDILLSVYPDGLPYGHGQYPVTHFSHLATGGFYGDSPLVDLNQLQKEYNTLRSDISETARRTARPQLLAAQGSIVPSKITNEPGLVIQYKQGFAPPTPMPIASIPAYMLQQQDRVLQDWNEIAGTSDISTGQAPAGVSAGTAINYLQEAANRYHTPQFQEIEFGHEHIASQTLALFQQYVDVQRKIKTIGADGAYDTMLLSGADIANGMDLRVEANSAAPTSQAAVQAKVMDMFSVGLIDPAMALKMLDVNGFQRMMDIVQAAEKKAQRENIKMKQLKPLDIENAQLQQANAIQQQVQSDPTMLQNPDIAAQLQAPTPPLMIPVDDFDNHQLHIQIHNAFRMGQEYETLPQEVKDQVTMHVAMHQHLQEAAMIAQFAQAVPDAGAPGADPNAPAAPSADPTAAAPTLGSNGPAGGPSAGS